MTDEFDVTKIILIVGEKNEKIEDIIETFAKNFSEDYKGLVNNRTELKIKMGKKKVKLILKVASSQKENLKNEWIKGSAVIFTYNITDRSSFEALEDWIQNVKNMSKSVPKIIVGTNQENFLNEEVDEDELKKFAKQNNALSYLIDTNNTYSIGKLFTDILSEVFRIKGPIQKKDSSSNYQATSKSKKEEVEQAEDEQAEVVQVILLGEENSQKKDIIRAYFDSHNSKFQNDYGSMTIKVGNKLVNLIIKGGYYRKDLNKIFIQNSSAGAFVYNTNDKNTFDELNGWFKTMDEIKPGAPKAIIGNLGKIENEEVDEKELENLAKDNNIKFYKVVNNDNIRELDELFSNLVNEVLQLRQSVNNGEKNKGNKKEGNGCCCLIV